MSLEFLGLQRTSLLDYPGEIAAVIFTYGCNLRCPYCHNPELVTGGVPGDFLPRIRVMDFLTARKRVLGGVVITGGEPLLHHDLPELIGEIQDMGLKVKLDTNGSFPERLSGIRPDFIAMDIKTAPEKYRLLGGAELSPETILRSLSLVLSSGIPHEFRTTLVPGIVDHDDLQRIAGLLSGCDSYVLAEFRSERTLSPEYREKQSFSEKEMDEIAAMMNMRNIKCRIRGKKKISGEGI